MFDFLLDPKFYGFLALAAVFVWGFRLILWEVLYQVISRVAREMAKRDE